MTAILATSDEPFRQYIRERLLEAGCEDIRGVELPAALAALLLESTDPVVVVGGHWPECRPFLKVAVGRTAPVIVILRPGMPEVERAALDAGAGAARKEGASKALRAGARAVVHADISTPSLRAALAAVHAGLIVLDRPLDTRQQSRNPDWIAHGGSHGAAGRRLTLREREILSLVAAGTSNKGVARALGVSTNTVKFHLTSAFEKLNAATRAGAVAEAIRRGELSL